MLTYKTLDQVQKDLERDEDFREFAYPDPLSPLYRAFRRERWGLVPAEVILAKIGRSPAGGAPWTVGFGFTKNVTHKSRISKEDARKVLCLVIMDHLPVLDKVLPNWRDLPDFAQTVVINMAFNLGSRLLQFKNSMALIGAGEYDQAARNLRKSVWYKQVGARAQRLVTRLERRAIPANERV